MLKVNNKNTRTPLVSNALALEHISHLFLEFLLSTLNKQILAGIVLAKLNSSEEHLGRDIQEWTK